MAREKKTSNPRSSKRKRRSVALASVSISESIGRELVIREHRLRGKGVTYTETPNKGGRIEPKYLVFHYTAGRSAQGSVKWLTNPDASASAHLVVGRNGAITQLAPFTTKTWHAGRSHWDGLPGLNQHSIGIEMDNAGPLTMVGSRLQAWFGKTYPKSQATHAKHKLDDEFRWWHAYTETQIIAAVELAKMLVKTYNLKEIVGHDDIAPDRKRDPGPAFPLIHIQAMVMGRPEEQSERYRVTATRLNIRKGPGAEFERASESLKKGTEVSLLEKRDRWSKVEVIDKNTGKATDVEGWVYNRYIESTSA
jgi:N-acetylmuramoyl-L-alanine amidase